MAEAKPLALHGGRRHFVCLPGPHAVREKRVFAVQDMSHGVELVWPQRDLRVHSGKCEVAAVVLARPGGVEQRVVFFTEVGPALRIFPDPVVERLLDCLLFLLRQGGFFLVQDLVLFPVRIFHLVEDPDGFQVECVLHDFVSVGTAGAVSDMDGNTVIAVLPFSADVPDAGHGRISGSDSLPVSQINRRFEGFVNKLIDVCRINPGCTETDVDFRRVQVLRLHLFERGRVSGKRRILFCGRAGGPQLFPHVAGKVFARCHPAQCLGRRIGSRRFLRLRENDAAQVLHDGRDFLRASQQGGHVLQIDARLFAEGNRKGLARRVDRRDHRPLPDGALGEHVGFAFQIPVFVDDFEGAEQAVGRILLKRPPVAAAVEQTVLCGEGVI